MAYHLTIVRTDKGKVIPITQKEFVTAAERQTNLRLSPDGERATLLRDDTVRATIAWNDGEIWTKTADDDEVLTVLLRIAQSLGARVRGDELETFRGIGDTYVHPDDLPELEASERTVAKIVSRRRRWTIVRIALIVTAIGLLLLRVV